VTRLPPTASLRLSLQGLLLGVAVGDALGLPAEGMSPARIRRRWHGQWRYRFLLGRGMVSDDTEHTFFVAQALLSHPDNVSAFQQCLAWKLRLWLLGVPAGIGLATLKATLKLWMGFSPARSGVFSAGNGPAMRSAIIGAYFADDPVTRRQFVSASTRITHTDPRAEVAALAVAEAAAWALDPRPSAEDWLSQLSILGQDPEWVAICQKLAASLRLRQSVVEFAAALGLGRGVTGYAYHSVPVALYAFLSQPDDFRAVLESALNCGGDTDTVGAIAGSLCGLMVSEAGIPQEWLNGICDWPRSRSLLIRIGARLAEQKAIRQPLGAVRYCWPGLIPRNAIFLVTVLVHGLRRLLPPY
jgi:ADP-ribosyl-[dinitrogen reductase] hydrolase